MTSSTIVWVVAEVDRWPGKVCGVPLSVCASDRVQHRRRTIKAMARQTLDTITDRTSDIMMTNAIGSADIGGDGSLAADITRGLPETMISALSKTSVSTIPLVAVYVTFPMTLMAVQRYQRDTFLAERVSM